MLASEDMEKAREFAIKTLDDIKQGSNPDLEEELRKKAKELNIDFDS